MVYYLVELPPTSTNKRSTRHSAGDDGGDPHAGQGACRRHGASGGQGEKRPEIGPSLNESSTPFFFSLGSGTGEAPGSADVLLELCDGWLLGREPSKLYVLFFFFLFSLFFLSLIAVGTCTASSHRSAPTPFFQPPPPCPRRGSRVSTLGTMTHSPGLGLSLACSGPSGPSDANHRLRETH